MFSDSITPGAHIDQLIDTAHRARAKLPVARHCRTTSGNSRPHSHTHTHHCGFADSPQLHLSCPVSTHTLSLSHTLSPPLLTNSARASSQVMRPLPPPGQITRRSIAIIGTVPLSGSPLWDCGMAKPVPGAGHVIQMDLPDSIPISISASPVVNSLRERQLQKPTFRSQWETDTNSSIHFHFVHYSRTRSFASTWHISATMYTRPAGTITEGLSARPFCRSLPCLASHLVRCTNGTTCPLPSQRVQL